MILMTDADVKQRIVGKVHAQRSVKNLTFILKQINIRATVIITANQSTTYRTGFIQRCRNINRALIMIPGTGCHSGVTDKFPAISTFTHQVYRCRRITGTANQAGRPADDFHPIVNGRIHQSLTSIVTWLPDSWHAINLQVINIKPPGRKTTPRAIAEL